MKIFARAANSLQDNTVLVIEHNGEHLEWPASTFKLSWFGPQTLELCNDYLSFQSPEFIENLWSIYSDLHSIVSNVTYVFETTVEKCLPLAARFFDSFDTSDLTGYLYPKRIVIPDTVKDDFTPDALSHHTQAGTYILSDYIDLCVMSVICRMFLPVWGMIIERFKKAIDTFDRDREAMGVMQSSNFFAYNPGIDKLRSYIRHTLLEKGKSLPAAVTDKLINEDEYILCVFSYVLFRRVCFGDMQGNDGMKNILTFVHIALNPTKRDSSQGPLFTDTLEVRKTTDRNTDGPSDDGQGSSVLEQNSVRRFTTIGQMQTVSVFCNNEDALLAALPKDFSRQTYDWFRPYVITLQQKAIINRAQMVLMSWIMHPWVQYQMLPIVEDGMFFNVRLYGMTNVMSLCQAYLWENGFEHLAVLLGCEARPVKSLGWNKIGIDKIDQIRQVKIAQLFPLSRSARRAKQGTITQIPNATIQAIDEMAKLWCETEWFTPIHPKQLELNYVNYQTRQVTLPAGFRNMLADLCIALRQRRIDAGI